MINDIESGGGAAIAASRLAEGLCLADHVVTRIVNEPDGAGHPWRTIRLIPSKRRWLRGLFQLSRNHHLVPAGGEALLDILYQRLVLRRLREILQELRPDVINFHNLHAARWGPELLAEAARWAPVVWTLHDTWSFTGRCCVESGCKLFTTGCDASCPTARDYPRLPRWRVQAAWLSRRNLLKSLPQLVGVSPSAWLAGYARQGLWRSHRLEIIPHGLDFSVFKPIKKSMARQLLGLQHDRPVLLITCANLSNTLKGGLLLGEALHHVETPVTLLALGAGGSFSGLERHRVVPMGYVSNPRLMAVIYSAADLLVHSSLAESFGLVLQEAIACGTPVCLHPHWRVSGNSPRRSKRLGGRRHDCPKPSAGD